MFHNVLEQTCFSRYMSKTCLEWHWRKWKSQEGQTNTKGSFLCLHSDDYGSEKVLALPPLRQQGQGQRSFSGWSEPSHRLVAQMLRRSQWLSVINLPPTLLVQVGCIYDAEPWNTEYPIWSTLMWSPLFYLRCEQDCGRGQAYHQYCQPLPFLAGKGSHSGASKLDSPYN